MVIGNGMIAQKFASYREDDRFIIFASGVSNSKNKNEEDYQREQILLQDTITANKEKRIVYFSTCSIYDNTENNSLYVLHKKNLEHYIQNNAMTYNIFRVSNIVGKSQNPNTVLNYYLYHIREKINFDLWINATRNLIGLEDVFSIIDYILKHQLYKNQIVNIANPEGYPVEKIIKEIECFLNIKANYSAIDKGGTYEVDTSALMAITAILNIDFSKDYLKRLLQKNY